MTTKPVGWFKFDPNQPRKDFNEEDDRRLGDSLKTHGQIQPVVARPDGTILCGERRVRAARLVGLTELTVIISDQKLTDSEIRMRQVAENVHRADLTGWEKYVAYYELLTLNPGWQQKDLADYLHLDPASVSRLLSASKCSKDWQDAFRDGKVTISDIYAASKLPIEDQAGLLALKLTGASRDDLERAGRRKRAGATSAARSSKIKVPLVSGAVVTVSGDEISLDDAIEAAGEAVKQMKAALAKGITAKSAMAYWKDVAAAG